MAGTADYVKCPCQKCGGHIEFPATAVGTTVTCPHCGAATTLLSYSSPLNAAPQKKNHKATFVVISLGLLFAVISGVAIVKSHSGKKQNDSIVEPIKSTQAETPNESPAPIPASDTHSDFVVGKISLQRIEGSGLVYATGTLKNLLKKQRFGVKVELNLLNEQDQDIGVASDYTPVIEAGKEWQFKALLAQPGTVKVTVADIKEQ
jgi:hypothetical protein